MTQAPGSYAVNRIASGDSAQGNTDSMAKSLAQIDSTATKVWAGDSNPNINRALLCLNFECPTIIVDRSASIPRLNGLTVGNYAARHLENGHVKAMKMEQLVAPSVPAQSPARPRFFTVQDD